MKENVKMENKEKLKNKTKKQKALTILKMLGVVIAIALLAFIAIELFPLMTKLTTTEGQVEFKEKIDSMGFLGMLMLFGLQFAQIFLVVLPGEPLEILAGMCYGSIGGMIFIFISVFIISSIIVFLVKFLGEKFVYEIWGKEKVKKIKKSKVFRNPKKVQLLLIILFLIPGTPKDLLTYIGALLPINSIEFILISTFARFPSIISSTIAGANIAIGDFKTMAIVYGITIIVTAVAVFVVSKLDKNTKDAIDIIK